MARMTIAQMREREIERLVAYRTETPTEADYKEARRLMNSFYRLCGLAETNLYRANNERLCNNAYTKELEEKEARWVERLSKEFTEFCGFVLFYGGYCPSIGTRDPRTGGVCEKVSRFFYQ